MSENEKQQRRIFVAAMALQGMLASGKISIQEVDQRAAERAVDYADALIADIEGEEKAETNG